MTALYSECIELSYVTRDSTDINATLGKGKFYFCVYFLSHLLIYFLMNRQVIYVSNNKIP